MPTLFRPLWTKLKQNFNRTNFVGEISNFRKESPKIFYSLMFLLPWPFIITFSEWRKRRLYPFMNFINSQTTGFMKNRFKTSIDDVFSQSEIKKALEYFIDRIFDKNTNNVIVDSILEVIKADPFLDQTKDWSKEWILKIFRSQEFKVIAKINTLSIVKSERTKSEGGEFVKLVVTDEDLKDSIGKQMKEIWLRDDVFSELMALLQKCGLQSLQNDILKQKASEMFLKIWSDNNFKSFVFDQSLSFWAEAEIDKFQALSPSKTSDSSQKENPYDQILKKMLKHPKL